MTFQMTLVYHIRVDLFSNQFNVQKQINLHLCLPDSHSNAMVLDS